MTNTNDQHENERDGSVLSESRRTLLKLTGAGAGIAAFGGISILSAGQEDDETETPGENETDGGEEMASDAALVDDLIDPTFGYPLAADETGSVSVETVVEAAHLQGGGAHEGFPVQPGPDGGEFPSEFVFDPVGVQVAPDEVVHFLSVAGEHTITAFDEKYANPELAIPTRVPEASPGFTSPPIIGGESWLYQFTEKGVYDILCLPHYVFGMVLRVVVFDPEEDSIDDEAFSVGPAEGVPPNVQAVLNAEELAPANIVEQGSVAWADLTIEGPSGEGPTEGETETSTGENESS